MINMSHFPVLAIMGLFFGAFLVALFGRKSAAVRNTISFIITAGHGAHAPAHQAGLDRWRSHRLLLGNWEPVSGWAIGIGIEVDALTCSSASSSPLPSLPPASMPSPIWHTDDSQANYFSLFLMLSGSVLGLVLSGDLFNIFVMIEIMTFSAVAADRIPEQL